MVVILPDDVAHDSALNRLSEIRCLRRGNRITNSEELRQKREVLTSLVAAGHEYDLTGLTIHQARRRLAGLGVPACGTPNLAIFDDESDEPAFVTASEDWVFGLGRIQCEPDLSPAERARLLRSPSVREFLYFEIPPGVDFYDATRAVKPVWHAATGELYYKGSLIKKYGQNAIRQRSLLHAFEEQGWPPRIADPVHVLGGEDSPGRLRQTVGDLLRGLPKPLVITFECDGTGKGVKWISMT